MENLDFSTLFIWRAVERLVAVLIGGGSIYLGFRLFMELPRLSTKGEGKFELPGGISIYVSRVGPGIFFALFGTVLVGMSFASVLSVGNEYAAMAPLSTPQRQEMAAFSYASGEIGPTQVSLERDTIVRDLRTLQKVEVALGHHAAGGPFDLRQADTASALVALPRIKRMMLHGTWDDSWGDYQAFAAWVRDGALGPPPEGLADLVADAFKTGD